VSVQAGPAGAIYDRGYRHYDGPREGAGRRVRAIAFAGFRRALGVKRSWKTKLVPFALVAIAFAPAVVFIGLRVLAGEQAEAFLGYEDYFNMVAAILLLFAGTAGPELLCPDRGHGVLALVFTRPVTWVDYLAGKLGAIAALVGLIALAPVLLLFTANVLTADSALDYLRDNLGDLGRILATGAALTVFYSLTALAVAAMTTRRAIATAVYIGLFLASTAIANIVFLATDLPGRRWLALVSLASLPSSIARWAFGSPPAPDSMEAAAGFGGGVYALAAAVIAVLAAALLADRIRRLTR
jgi:ABC-2 type transport system permease protein